MTRSEISYSHIMPRPLPPSALVFADQHKRCACCAARVYAVLTEDGGYRNWPCDHQAAAVEVCLSWSPVDGCACTDPATCRMRQASQQY